MNIAENYLSEAKNKIFDKIKFLVTDIYVKHGGSLKDAKKLVTDDEIGRTSQITIGDDRWYIEEYRITGGELSFICGISGKEVKPQEVSAEELVRIYTNLYNYWKKL